MKKAMSSILIIIGVLLVASPFINNLIIYKNLETSRKVTYEISKEQIAENNEKQSEYNYDEIQDTEIVSTIKSAFSDWELSEKIIGQIVIKDLDIDLPILKGITHSNMLMGAGTMKPDLVMGDGNYTLSSHYSRSGNLFGKLLEIENGTIVKITDKETIYEYMIYDTQIVSDTALYMLDSDRVGKRGKPILSLMTCYYTSKNGNRFFALGELVNQYPYE